MPLEFTPEIPLTQRTVTLLTRCAVRTWMYLRGQIPCTWSNIEEKLAHIQMEVQLPPSSSLSPHNRKAQALLDDEISLFEDLHAYTQALTSVEFYLVIGSSVSTPKEILRLTFYGLQTSSPKRILSVLQPSERLVAMTAAESQEDMDRCERKFARLLINQLAQMFTPPLLRTHVVVRAKREGLPEGFIPRQTLNLERWLTQVPVVHVVISPMEEHHNAAPVRTNGVVAGEGRFHIGKDIEEIPVEENIWLQARVSLNGLRPWP